MIRPVNNISPFTYRDGETYLEILYRLRNYITGIDGVGGLVNEFTLELDRIIEEFNASLEATATAANELSADWTARFETFMGSLNANIQALNDHALAGLVNTPASETGAALAAGFYTRTPATAVYVNNTTGNDANTGTAGAPLRTVTEAIRRAANSAQVTDTANTINLTGGVWTERVTAPAFTAYKLNVVIQGSAVEYPGRPVVQFTEGSGTSAAAMKFTNPNAAMTVKYVEFIGYNGTTSSAGINSVNGELYTVNVWANGCFFGISSQSGSLDVKGGVLDNNGRLPDGTGSGASIRSLMLNRHSIGVQGAGNLNAGPKITNSRYGFFAQENSTGHTDYITYEDNESAVVLRGNSRANVDGSSFKRNLTDILADSASHVYVPDTVAFGTGANKSSQTVVLTSGSQSTTTRDMDGSLSALSRTEQVQYGIYTAQTVTGTTATVRVLQRTLYAPWWNDTQRTAGSAPKRLRIRAAGRITGGAGTVQLTLVLGSRTLPITMDETGTFHYEGSVLFAAPDRQILVARSEVNLAPSARNTTGTTAQDMSADQLIYLYAQLSNAADSVTFEYVEISAG